MGSSRAGRDPLPADPSRSYLGPQGRIHAAQQAAARARPACPQRSGPPVNRHGRAHGRGALAHRLTRTGRGTEEPLPASPPSARRSALRMRRSSARLPPSPPPRSGFPGVRRALSALTSPQPGARRHWSWRLRLHPLAAARRRRGRPGRRGPGEGKGAVCEGTGPVG